jgi:hypothetical protein
MGFIAPKNALYKKRNGGETYQRQATNEGYPDVAINSVILGPNLFVQEPPNAAATAVNPAPVAMILLTKGSVSTRLPPAPRPINVEFMPEQQNTIRQTIIAWKNGLF